MYYIGNEEIEAIKKVFEKKKLFRYQMNQKSECQLFEEEFSKHINSPFALMVTSGTNALRVALKTLNIRDGDEVIIPSYTFVATALAVVNVGATPIVVNIDETLTISCKEILASITNKTKAIICVHMDGLACDMNELTKICHEHKLHLIEDCAQAIGGSYNGKHLGTWGEFGCFSLNQDKNISCGEGGIVVCKTKNHMENAFCIQDGSGVFNPVNKDFFKEISPFAGESMRVSEISGAIMRVQLTRLEDILQKLRERKKILKEEITSKSVQIVGGHCLDGDCGSSLHLYFQSPTDAQLAGKKLRESEIMVIPPSMRPAHACWKWLSIIKSTQNPGLFLQTTNILMSTLKLDIDISLGLEDIKNLGKKINQLLGE